MDSEERRFSVESNKKIFIIFKDFLASVAKYEELLDFSGRLLHGFQQGLEVCTCRRDLQDHLVEANTILKELRCLVEDATAAIQYSENNIAISNEACDGILDMHVQNPKATDYGALIGVIYSMVRQDYEMQEKIISSLSLRSSSEELDSYCLMWSLRPFINDDILNQAWTIVS